jgi:putative glutathione S-transferase
MAEDAHASRGRPERGGDDFGQLARNLRRMEDYANLSGFLRELYQVPGIAETVDLDHVKRHYYMSHAHINPSRIVPVGPLLDFSRPHGRG